jgi:hypothetical protein
VVSSRARSRAAVTRSRMLTTPGWTRRDEDRYSHASRNSSFRESRSIARSNRNSSRSFQRGSSTCRSRGRRRSRAGDWYGSARGHRSRAARRPGSPASATAAPPRRPGRRPRHPGRIPAMAACTAAPPRPARCPAAELADERLISRREREVPDQLGAGRLGKPPQLRQLIILEHVPGRHRRPFPRRAKPDGEHPTGPERPRAAKPRNPAAPRPRLPGRDPNRCFFAG